MTKANHARRRRRPAPRSLRDYLAGPPPVSQRQLAALTGCNQSMISMLARGKRIPSAGLAVRLHAATGVPLKALLGMKIGQLPARLPVKRKRPAARGDPGRQHASA